MSAPRTRMFAVAVVVALASPGCGPSQQDAPPAHPRHDSPAAATPAPSPSAQAAPSAQAEPGATTVVSLSTIGVRATVPRSWTSTGDDFACGVDGGLSALRWESDEVHVARQAALRDAAEYGLMSSGTLCGLSIEAMGALEASKPVIAGRTVREAKLEDGFVLKLEAQEGGWNYIVYVRVKDPLTAQHARDVLTSLTLER